MAGLFKWCLFKDVDLDDSFFNSLKEDYAEFSQWFKKKSDEDAQALVFKDESGIGAFLYLKEEDEAIELIDTVIPSKRRLKIVTLRIDERYRRMRLGEGAIGVALWHWRDSGCEEVYVTVYEKHDLLIALFKEFGFSLVGHNRRGECIYVKNKKSIDFTNPCTAFPYIRNEFEFAGIIPIEDQYHDRLFPYSELKGVKEVEEDTAKNGIKKVFIAAPSSEVAYRNNEPVFMYRKHTGPGQRTYKSVITSFCTITNIMEIKSNGNNVVPFEDFVSHAGNKTVYEEDELHNLYTNKRNILLIEMVYNGFFGRGHNVTHRALDEANLFRDYPYNIIYTEKEFRAILNMGGVNEHDIIAD